MFRVCLLATILLATSAYAEPKTEHTRVDPKLEEAKAIAKQAAVQYNLGRFAEASDAYGKSYELVPTPGLLFNLGQCQMELKNWSKAVFFFEGYLRDKPDAPNVALVHDLEAEAKKAIGDEEQKKQAEAAAQLAAMRPVVLPPPPPPPPPPRDKRRVPAVVLGAVSIALTSAAVYLGMRADESLVAERETSGDTKSSFKSDRTTYSIAGGAVGAVALGTAIASGVLGYLAWRTPKVKPNGLGFRF